MAVVMMFLINPLMAIFSVIMIPLSLIISRTIVKISPEIFPRNAKFFRRLKWLTVQEKYDWVQCFKTIWSGKENP